MVHFQKVLQSEIYVGKPVMLAKYHILDLLARWAKLRREVFQSLFSYCSWHSQFYCPQETPDSNCRIHIFNVGSRLKCNNKLSDSYLTSFSSLTNSLIVVREDTFISFSCSLLSVLLFYVVTFETHYWWSETNHSWCSHLSLLINHHKWNIISLKIFLDPPLSAFSKILETGTLQKLEKD